MLGCVCSLPRGLSSPFTGITAANRRAPTHRKQPMPRGLLPSRLPALLQPAAAPGARAALLGGAAALPPAWCGGAGCVRAISEERLNASPEHLEDLFQRSLSRASRRRSQGVLLTTGREALALYREVLRYSNLFVWRDAQGRVFRDLIRQSARGCCLACHKRC